MVNRMTGIMSGLDTETLVKQMMLRSQTRYDNLYKKKVESEWKKTLYNDIYKQIKELDTKLFDYSMSAKTSTKKATSSNEAVATITASAGAANASHTLSVSQLAEVASVGSSGTITTGSDKSSLASQFGIAANTNMTFKINDKEITINSDASISDLVSEINKSGAGVNASYDSNMDRFFITSKTTGKDAKIEFTTTDTNATNLINSLKLKDSTEASIGVGDTAEGKNAIFKLDGIELENANNDFTISGISYSLKSKSEGTTLLNVKTDNDAIVDNVKSLIETYNNLLSVLNTTKSEKYYRNYEPLTEEQKKEMTEKEIELWEEKAKSGLLRNDSILSGLATKMRTTMYGQSSSVVGDYNSLSKLGISTTNYADQGVLTINEEKLREALEKDPDAVHKLFTADDGFVKGLRKELQNSMKDLETKAGAGKTVDTSSTLYKQIYKYENQMTSMSAKLVAEENRYYAMFASMETALSKMNSQNNYLTSMLGG